jgi:nicotinate-nucleotide--dimethylbenzimidazole phosphoribosyltransferase
MKFEIDIPHRDDAAIDAAVTGRWNSLTKPPGSLGRLESVVLDFARMRGEPRPSCKQKAIYIFCGDHGVTAEGVSSWPSKVTAQMVANFVCGGAAICVLCRRFGIHTVVVDAGVAAGPLAGVTNRKIARGTRNFATEPAMTRMQAIRAIEAGAELARTLTGDIAGVGEMGIGNSTSASALLCAFTGCQTQFAAGRGAGLDESGVRRKAAVIDRALALHRPSPSDPIGTLAALGGFEIAMMAGFVLGAASCRLPVVVDGFISGAAVLAARAIQPRVVDYVIYSHRSAERGHAIMLGALGARPLLDLQMRLGEGTGAALAINLIESALSLYEGMATFAEAAVTGRA